MRITEINHVGFDFKDGLQDIYLRDLGRLVVVAGPNGAGKTRLLRRLYRMSGTRVDADSNTLAYSIFLEWKKRYQQPATLDEPKFTIPTLETPIDLELWKHAKELEQPGDTRAFGIAIGRHPEDNEHHGRKDLKNTLIINPYGTQSTALKDSSDFLQNEISLKSRDCDSIGLNHLPDSATSYIQRVQDLHFEATHPAYEHKEKKQFIEKYNTLNAMIKTSLGVGIERNHERIATLFGKPVAHARLSDGQVMLLLIAISLHAQGRRLSNAILTIDEPETHLHPEAMLKAFDQLIKLTANGQIWIATHSVPLLAHLHDRYREIASFVYMADGKASYAGRSPEVVLNSLMGGADNVLSLRKFLDLPDVLAINTFAAECFEESRPKGYVDEDPQCNAAIKSIGSKTGSQKQKVLDFGAGHCRLLEALVAKHGDSFEKAVDYYAYEKEPSDKLSKPILSKHYADPDSRLFTSRGSLFLRHSKKSFDTVVLCNVLHEISPTKWLSLFSADETIHSSLKSDGFLLIIEDYLMPVGEHAHEYGFIVLDSEPIKDLFQIEDGDGYEVIHGPDKYKDRIRAHKVPAKCLPRINTESRAKALRSVEKLAKEKISAIREQPQKDYKSGLQHAFWVQQYANVNLALQDLATLQ